jgi:hypothetical protein
MNKEMTMDAKATLRGTLLLLLSFSLIVMFAGCSSDGSFPINSPSTGIQPPPLTEENLAAGPAPGYSYLNIDVTSLFPGMSAENPMLTQRLLFPGIGGSVYFPDPLSGIGGQTQPVPMDWWHGVYVPPDAIRESVMIGMCVPNPTVAAVDFSPHPYQFERIIRVELSYHGSNLAQMGATPQDLVIMWWNENLGEYQEIPTQLNARAEKLYGITDHFSRYIIASGGGS